MPAHSNPVFRYVVSRVRISGHASTCCQVMLPVNHESVQNGETLAASGLFAGVLPVECGRPRSGSHEPHRATGSGTSAAAPYFRPRRPFEGRAAAEKRRAAQTPTSTIGAHKAGST